MIRGGLTNLGDLQYRDYLPHGELMSDGWHYPRSGDVFSFIVQKDLDGKNFINKLIEKKKPYPRGNLLLSV